MLPDEGSERVDRLLRPIIIAGVAITTALVSIVAVGLGARIEGLSPGSVMQIVLIAVLGWPVYNIAPRQSDLDERVRGLIRSHRVPIALAIILMVGSRIPYVPDLLATVVYLPFGPTSEFFFGAELFYRPHLGFVFGRSSASSGNGT